MSGPPSCEPEKNLETAELRREVHRTLRDPLSRLCTVVVLYRQLLAASFVGLEGPEVALAQPLRTAGH